MNITFIGAGKVGKALGLYLYNKGIKVIGYYSKTNVSAEIAALSINGNVFTNLYDLSINADVIIIATPDDIINEIVKQLDSLSIDWNNKIVIHTSGVHSSMTLSALFTKGATILSLHPMLAFSYDYLQAEKDLSKAVFTIEGQGTRFMEIKDLFRKLGNQLIEIKTEDKVAYHAAATLVSNYTVTLIDITLNMLENIGFSRESAISLIEPLIRNNIDNVLIHGTEEALTGPISRGDTGTVLKHLELLNKYDESVLNIYIQLGLETLDLAKRANRISQESIIKLKEVLDEYDQKSYNSNI